MDEPLSDQYVGPPRLLGFSLETPASTENVDESGDKAKSPTCVLSVELEDKLYFSGCSKSTVKLELQPSTMDTVLDGLYRIKNQLSVLQTNNPNA